MLIVSCSTLDTVHVPNNLSKIERNLKLMEDYIEYDVLNGLMDTTSAIDYLLIINNTQLGIKQMKYKLNTNTKR